MEFVTREDLATFAAQMREDFISEVNVRIEAALLRVLDSRLPLVTVPTTPLAPPGLSVQRSSSSTTETISLVPPTVAPVPIAQPAMEVAMEVILEEPVVSSAPISDVAEAEPELAALVAEIQPKCGAASVSSAVAAILLKLAAVAAVFVKAADFAVVYSTVGTPTVATVRTVLLCRGTVLQYCMSSVCLFQQCAAYCTLLYYFVRTVLVLYYSM